MSGIIKTFQGFWKHMNSNFDHSHYLRCCFMQLFLLAFLDRFKLVFVRLSVSDVLYGKLDKIVKGSFAVNLRFLYIWS